MSKIAKRATGYLSDNNTRYVWLDGKICQDINDCYTYLQEQLSLPVYFGKNLDALEEMLADLEWIREERVCIVIQHLTDILAKESSRKTDFFEILNNCTNEKLQIIYIDNTSISVIDSGLD